MGCDDPKDERNPEEWKLAIATFNELHDKMRAAENAAERYRQEAKEYRRRCEKLKEEYGFRGWWFGTYPM